MKVCPKCFTETPDETRYCPNCGEGIPAEDESEKKGLIGSLIAGKFRVLSTVGEGAMGSIYKAEQMTLQKLVCIKVLHPHLSGDRTISKRFHREARAASRIKHPNAINIIDFGTAEDGTHYIAMDFIDGQDLAHLIRGQFPLETERCFHMTDQICSALDDAHAQGVIHRDLKPENIMVEDRRHQKDFVTVLDFGIAKIKDPSGENADTFHTMAGIVCGTPEYMSPEQARGESLDARSDIYSLGIIMYHMFTGKLPFTADTPIGVVTKHLTQEAIRPREIRPEIHPAVEALIMRLMAKDREQRPATCQDVKVEVDLVRKQIASGDAFDQTAPMPRPSTEELFSADSRPLDSVGDAFGEEEMASSRKSLVWLWVTLGLLLTAGVVAWLFLYGPLAGRLTPPEDGSQVAGDEVTGAPVATKQPAGKGSQESGESQAGDGASNGQSAGMTPAEMLKLAGQMTAITRTLGEYQVSYAQNDRMLAMRLAEWEKLEDAERVAAIKELQGACAKGRARITTLQEMVEGGDLAGAEAAIEAEKAVVAKLDERVEALLAVELPTSDGQKQQAGQKLAELTAQIAASRQELALGLEQLEEKKAAWSDTPETKPIEELDALADSLRSLDGEYEELLAGLSQDNVSRSAVQYGKRLGRQDVYKEQVAAALKRPVGPTRAQLEAQAAQAKQREEEQRKLDEEKRKRDEEKRKVREADLAKAKAQEDKARAEAEKAAKAAAEKAAKEQNATKAAEFEQLGDEARSQGSYAKAIAYYKQSLKLRSNTELYKKLGKTYNSKGDYANGASHLRKYLDKMGSKLSPSARKLIESQIRD